MLCFPVPWDIFGKNQTSYFSACDSQFLTFGVQKFKEHFFFIYTSKQDSKNSFKFSLI